MGKMKAVLPSFFYVPFFMAREPISSKSISYRSFEIDFDARILYACKSFVLYQIRFLGMIINTMWD